MAADEGGVCPDEGRAMRSSPLRLQAQRFGCRHSQPPTEFPCSAPQRDGKSPKTTGNPANAGLFMPSHDRPFITGTSRLLKGGRICVVMGNDRVNSRSSHE
jgi:hypothetical protein